MLTAVAYHKVALIRLCLCVRLVPSLQIASALPHQQSYACSDLNRSLQDLK